MKKLILAFSMLIAFTTISMAQQNEFEYLKSQYKNDRKTLLMNYLKLSDSAATKFWPIYDKYESERGELANKRFTNLKNYADQYQAMTNDQADAFQKTFFENNTKEMDIKKKYFGQFKKSLGAKTALAWLQFEEYIDAALQYELLSNIPFVGNR